MHALLPTSAAPKWPRSSPIIVLNKPELWLTEVLKNTRGKKPKNASQHTKMLTEALLSPTTWTLCSIIFPKVSSMNVEKDVPDDPLPSRGLCRGCRHGLAE
jgi:hypothetical protein